MNAPSGEVARGQNYCATLLHHRMNQFLKLLGDGFVKQGQSSRGSVDTGITRVVCACGCTSCTYRLPLLLPPPLKSPNQPVSLSSISAVSNCSIKLFSSFSLLRNKPSALRHRGNGARCKCSATTGACHKAMARGQCGQVHHVDAWGVGTAAMHLLGAPLPVEEEFCWLGIGIRVQPEQGTGPLLQKQMEWSASVFTCMPQLATSHQRSIVARSLALAVAMHGVEPADIDLARLKTRTIEAIRGLLRPGWAKEVVYCLLSQGHRTSPIMRMKYDKLAWWRGSWGQCKSCCKPSGSAWNRPPSPA